jgi:galactokinase
LEQQGTSLRQAFARAFAATADLSISRAPGRVNLIGEHTDYNGGFVLPMAVDRAVRVCFRPVRTGPVRLRSEDMDSWVEFELDAVGPPPDGRVGWGDYVRGVAWALREAGCGLRPIEGIVQGDVPIGAGLSSSAALEVAVARAFCAASGCDIGDRALALACQRAEHEFARVRCGIMDQFVSIFAREGHALLLDCRSLGHEHVPMDTSALCVVVCDTRVRHDLGTSAYNERRASCERAVHMLSERLAGASQLRDVSPETLAQNADVLDEVTFRRARHVVGEIARTVEAAEALKAHAYARVGRLMAESHRSLRDDYEVSCEELDLMVDLADGRAGVFGSRMVGAGFGGCTVNLVSRPRSAEFARGIAADYEARTGVAPDVYEFSAAGGADVHAC